ncbi:MAG: VWA domain-containing protein [Bradyrhizobiaceae bacterium]|nr:VWA domain-containing protein [Bradyrhizobiaceae bacterium]
MIRVLLAAMLLCLSYSMTLAQGNLFLRSFSSDSSGLRTASAVYFNAERKITNFTKDELSILEGGLPARIVSVTCNPPGPSTLISSVLTIDVSGSMRFGGPNIDLAKQAAQAWIDALEEGSDAAVTAFDHSAVLQCDLTEDKTELRSAVDRLRPRGGTNYERGLLDSIMGSLAIARVGTHKRVVVFLTDGFGSVDADSVINQALQDSVTIYCVTLGLNMPGVLQRVAEGTGGLWFDNVTTVEQAVMAYQRIFADATGAGGCTIVWDPPPSCASTTSLRATVYGAMYETDIDVPPQRRGGVDVRQPSLQFDSAGSLTKSFTIVNRAAATTITSIRCSRPDAFTMGAIKLPYTIQPGDSLVVSFTCIKSDTTFIVADVELDAQPCPTPLLYLTSGNPLAPPSRKTLTVVHPNGGERLPARSMTDLRWTGIPPGIPVKVEISFDAGRTWMLVSEGEKGLTRRWNTGHETSDSCLLRVSHVKPQADQTKPMFTITGKPYSDVAYTPDGKLIVTGQAPGLSGQHQLPPPAMLWDGVNGTLVSVLGQGERVLISSKGDRLLTWARDSVAFYTLPDGALRWRRAVTKLPIACDVSSDGRYVVVGGADGDVTSVLDAINGNLLAELPRRQSAIRDVSISPNGAYVAVCEQDSMVRLFSVTNTQDVRILKSPNVPSYYSAVFSPDSRSLIAVDGAGNTSLWDVATLEKPRPIASRFFKNDNTYAAFSPDGRRLAVETGRDETKIVDVATGNHVVSIRRLSEPGGASSAQILANNSTLLLSTLSFATAFDAQTGIQLLRVQRGVGRPSAPADGSKMAVIDASSNVQVYDLRTPLLQQDQSDGLWSIYYARAVLAPVRLRQCAVGQSVDSIVVSAITNTSKDSITIRGLRIEGTQAPDFGLNAPKEFVLAPGESRPITYSFHPHAVGERAALIVAETSSGIINARISGRCPPGVLQAGSDIRDLGTVPIGTPVTITVKDLLHNTGSSSIRIRDIRTVAGADPTITVLTSGGVTLPEGQHQSIDVQVTAPRAGRFATQVEFLVNGFDDPITATLFVRADSNVFAAHADPTTFRSIMLPSAIIPPAGTITTGVYDVLGVSLGYSVTDNLMVLVGGMLPFNSAWIGFGHDRASASGAWSVGMKGAIPLAPDLVFGGGFQLGQSWYNQELTNGFDSKITFNALWATLGYGNDDSRLNLYLGYAFKDHTTLFDGRFRADATIAGIAYDYRIAEQWKLCAETFFMRTMDFIPITGVARYFRETDAFEFGISYVGISTVTSRPSSGWKFVPMVSWVKRW